MSNLYEQMDFILSGGALRSLVEFLTPKVSAALIVTPKGSDMEIADAVGAAPDGLFLRGWAPRLISAFPERNKNKKFEVRCARVDPAAESEWPWALAIRGKRWEFYVLLRETPEAFLSELEPVAGLVALWQEFQCMGAVEERLSRMAYMILATKSTLASIFEPMPLNYYAAFLTDVINESLFPRSISIFRDNGSALELIEGDETPPAREGIYAQTLVPPPTPVVTKSDVPPYEVVLPIAEPFRLYCVTKWDKLPEEEALDFLELVSNLASRALTINNLKTETFGEQKRISSGQYTILALNGALSALKTRKSRNDLLSMAVDIFTEMTNVGACLLVAWDERLNGYVPAEYRKGGIKTPCEPVAAQSEKVFCDQEKMGMTSEEFSELMQCPWPEMTAMKTVFPIWDRGSMDGFFAVASDRAVLKDGDKFSALGIVAQFTAFSLRNF